MRDAPSVSEMGRHVAGEGLDHDCPGQVIEEVQGGSYVLHCRLCGWAVATSYCAIVDRDKTIYWLSVVSADPGDRDELALMARIFGGMPVSIFKRMRLGVLPSKNGSAYAVRGDILALREAGTAFRVDPPYPWRLADGSRIDHVPGDLAAPAADDTVYRVSVVSADRTDRDQLGAVVGVFGGTLTSVYRAIGSGILPSKSGPALAVRGDMLVLKAVGIAFRVDPPFPWRLADGSPVADSPA